MKRTWRVSAAAAIIALPLALTACGSDDTDSSTEGSTTTTTQMDDTTSGNESDETEMNTGDDPASMAFGPGCSAIPATGPGSFEEMAMQPVATAASGNEMLSTLVTAVQAAGLVDTLNDAEAITVFAPINDAFAALPAETLDAALADPSGLLTDVLTNHVVEGRVGPDEVAGEHQTLGGGTVTVTGSGEAWMVGEANVICGNVQTANATVYVIDQVLLPA